MLLEFKAKNYKSFKDEFIFSMIPAPKQKGLDYSILNQKIGSKEYKGLCSAVIYGPNASGKTNIIGAMEVFKSIILRGNIKNSDDKNSPNAAVNELELIPNSIIKSPVPVEFSIKFIENNLLIQYDLSIDIGNFLGTDYQRKILSEKLTVNEQLVFSRDKKLNFASLYSIKPLKNYWINKFENNINVVTSLAKSNLNCEELFLTNGFKNLFSTKLVNLITDWLRNKFIVIYRANALNLEPSNFKKQTIYVEKTTNDAARLFGINSNALGYISRDNEAKATLCSILNLKNGRAILPAEMFESYGTIRFINMFPLVIRAILTGGTLIVDEFDASLHPMALMNIINIFHNDEINKKNAQLIFNTHNPIFLNSNLFRRDEVKFVERDDETHFSKHYSLSDFGTTGDTGVRKDEDYMKKYFISQYGAIKDIDFTPIFENLWDERKEVQSNDKNEIQ